jgi:DNA topoisomerase-1
MAKKSSKSNGRALVIVESPAKARTIGQFLGRDYMIEASIGHVRDLPENAKQIPAEFKKEEWARLGVNVNENFEPIYVIPPGKQQQVKKLKGLVKEARELYLATDEDREGEAISWHLRELLKPRIPVRRLVFHEITKEAIQEALEHPRDIDNALVRAQETRRIVDRLYGYEVSPLLWRKVGPRLSAGRVQSVAVRLIVDRERERMAFVPATYWDLLGTFVPPAGEAFEAKLMAYQGRRVPTAKDFDPATGRCTDSECLLLDEAAAAALAKALEGASFKVARVEEKIFTSKPLPPFTTSTLQQEANRKLRFTARRTMQVAQSLYETGHITYMRTDSTTLASVAIEAARDLVRAQYGKEYLPDQPRIYQTKVRNAQEAHEAIRPAGHPFDVPEKLRGELSEDEFKLYDLIWKRTIASQMSDARGRRVTLTIEGGNAMFQVGGSIIDFAGYLRAYVEGSDDPQAELAERETVLPAVAEGDALECRRLEPKSHTTQPPARYTEATLTRTLEELGIGRPSTYATIIDTILDRRYVFKRGNALVPTWVGFAVSNLLEAHLPRLVDYGFTAKMEDDLDAISRGEAEHVDYLRQFYFGNGQPGLKQQLAHKADEIDVRAVGRVLIGQPASGPHTEPIYVRVGRYGPFLEQGSRRVSIPDDLPPDELNVEKALELLDRASQAEQPIGYCPNTGKPVFLKVGRFGPYVQRGTADDAEKPQNASLLRGMKPEDVDLATALKLLSLPREIGIHPQWGKPIVAHNGRFGPYIKCGDETRSLGPDMSPLDITLEQAVALLAQPKAMRRGFGAPREPLKILGESPVTREPVKLMSGRYGPYVTDGTTNASLPKDASADELTLEQALALLAARAAAGPPKRGRRKAAASRSAGAKQKTAPAAKAAKKKGAMATTPMPQHTKNGDKNKNGKSRARKKVGARAGNETPNAATTSRNKAARVG